MLVAEDAHYGPIGLCSLGAARDGGVGFEGEIYTLYVDPAFLGRGTGRALLAGAFEAFKERKLRSCLIWAHARNNACFFYEAMGGVRVATRTTRLMGELTPEIGFGWKRWRPQSSPDLQSCYRQPVNHVRLDRAAIADDFRRQVERQARAAMKARRQRQQRRLPVGLLPRSPCRCGNICGTEDLFT